MADSGGRNFSFKCVLLGEGCVGKTSLVLRYVENKFNDKHITTLQVIKWSFIHTCLYYVLLLLIDKWQQMCWEHELVHLEHM